MSVMSLQVATESCTPSKISHRFLVLTDQAFCSVIKWNGQQHFNITGNKESSRSTCKVHSNGCNNEGNQTLQGLDQMVKLNQWRHWEKLQPRMHHPWVSLVDPFFIYFSVQFIGCPKHYNNCVWTDQWVLLLDEHCGQQKRMEVHLSQQQAALAVHCHQLIP